ncbi:hypothetical protein HK102_006691 [Quaeritorhiza haematococci]|nr:hypothetical protein HK102_006691 [Quaeritorhiza haematococci]
MSYGYGYGASASSSPRHPNDGSLDTEVRLFTTNKEREKYDNMADLYGIIVATEHLERAYIRDAITPQDDYVPSIEEFMERYKLSCPAATKRLLEIGVPATVEHAAVDSGQGQTAKYVAETVQSFITLMDSIKLNMVAVDQIHPLLSELIQGLNKISSLPLDYEGKVKIRNWVLSDAQSFAASRASDEMDEDQVRQLLFDLER